MLRLDFENLFLDREMAQIVPLQGTGNPVLHLYKKLMSYSCLRLKTQEAGI